ncbi:hypothetical protein P3T76_016156 [Phytophthora citrophthora]|uniref:Uncharacterized protein n=1 Tax=Phytophthora citrophthora TaxID=4793 RepID=A0AAD9FY19_9STRA|nr:hypothetical protein P3T76_016156 [Phytophthora citrophthora]
MLAGGEEALANMDQGDGEEARRVRVRMGEGRKRGACGCVWAKVTTARKRAGADMEVMEGDGAQSMLYMRH